MERGVLFSWMEVTEVMDIWQAYNHEKCNSVMLSNDRNDINLNRIIKKRKCKISTFYGRNSKSNLKSSMRKYFMVDLLLVIIRSPSYRLVCLLGCVNIVRLQCQISLPFGILYISFPFWYGSFYQSSTKQGWSVYFYLSSCNIYLYILFISHR